MHTHAEPVADRDFTPVKRFPAGSFAHTRGLDEYITRIASEFHQRHPRAISAELQLAAFAHLGQFLSGEPTLLLNQLTATLLHLCNGDGAAVIFGDHTGRQIEITWVASAGTLAQSPRSRQHWRTAIQSSLYAGTPEVFRLTSRTASAGPAESMPREGLIVPFGNDASGFGAILLTGDSTCRNLDPTDERIVSSLCCFAKLGREKSSLDMRSARGFASAAKLANQLAHKINNPLQALMNSLHLIPSDDLQSAHLDDARQQARRISDVVKSTLEIGACKDPWL